MSPTPPWLTDLLFWQQVDPDASRTIVCSPGMEGAIRAVIDKAGLRPDLHKIEAASFCSGGGAYMVDELASIKPEGDALAREARSKAMADAIWAAWAARVRGLKGGGS